MPVCNGRTISLLHRVILDLSYHNVWYNISQISSVITWIATLNNAKKDIFSCLFLQSLCRYETKHGNLTLISARFCFLLFTVTTNAVVLILLLRNITLTCQTWKTLTDCGGQMVMETSWRWTPEFWRHSSSLCKIVLLARIE